MPKVTRQKIKYTGKDGAALRAEIRSDSSGGCRYVRIYGRRPRKKVPGPIGYFGIDVCVDCGTVYVKNTHNFRVDTAQSDRLRLALFEVERILKEEYNLDNGKKEEGLYDIFGLPFHRGARRALEVVKKAVKG